MENKVFSGVANGATYLLAMAQYNEILQAIMFTLSALTSVVLIAYNIWSWWKKAKADGKITNDEINELHDIIEDGKEEIDNIKKDYDDSQKGE